MFAKVTKQGQVLIFNTAFLDHVCPIHPNTCDWADGYRSKLVFVTGSGIVERVLADQTPEQIYWQLPKVGK